MRLSVITAALLSLTPTLAAPQAARSVLPFPKVGDPNIINPTVGLNFTKREFERRSQCAATLSTAEGVASRLQSHYWSSSNGYYTGGLLWGDANTFENLVNLMLAAGTTTYASQILASQTMEAGANSGTNWSSYLNGANDDALWVVLAFIKMYDYQTTHGASNAEQFLSSAITIYNMIVGQWDSTCGGGVWWSTAHTYKNAVTNQLFLSTSAILNLRTGQSTFLTNAETAWSWLLASGMRNSEGLWNDGLTSSCTNNGQTTWIYNQGVLASGLAAIYQSTGTTSYLTEAEITLDATVEYLTVNDILKESCDDAASGGSVCDNDQANFKGIWLKHLQYYLDSANDATRTAKYAPFIGSQESAVVHYGTDSSDDIGTVWYAPNAGGSDFTPEASSSGLAAHVVAAKYGPC